MGIKGRGTRLGQERRQKSHSFVDGLFLSSKGRGLSLCANV